MFKSLIWFKFYEFKNIGVKKLYGLDQPLKYNCL